MDLRRISIGLAGGLLAVSMGCAANEPVRTERGSYRVVERGAWQVMDGSEPIGRLVLLELKGHQPPLLYYRAETPTGQWAGYVGRNGRFFKLVPFRPVEEGPKDLGYYPMKEGLAKLFEVPGLVRIVPEAGADELAVPTEAAAHKGLRRILREAASEKKGRSARSK